MGTKTGSLVLKGAFLLLAMLMHAWLYGAAALAAPEATATSAHLSGDETRTTFRLDLTAGVTAEIFTLANPYRVIVDLPDVSFRLPDGTGQTGHGLVEAFRGREHRFQWHSALLGARTPVWKRKEGRRPSRVAPVTPLWAA